jgi:hypothetical protein
MPESNDQTVLYKEYYDLVAKFNQVNAAYLEQVGDIARQRQMGIERAIAIHIKPAIAKLDKIRMISVLVGGFAGFAALALFCNASVYDRSGSLFSWLLITVFVVATIASLVVFAWVNSKVSDLNAKAKAARDTQPTV